MSPLFYIATMKRVYINSLRKYADEVDPANCRPHLKHLLHDTTSEKPAQHRVPDSDGEDGDGEQLHVDSTEESSNGQGDKPTPKKPRTRRKKGHDNNP